VQLEISETEETLKIMGIEKEDFSIPSTVLNIFYVNDYEVVCGYGEEWNKIYKPNKKFEFDTNRIGKVWEWDSFILLWTSSDGHAEAGYFLFNKAI